MAKNGVRDVRGKCQIRWQDPVTGVRRSKVLDLPYTPAGIDSAVRIRARLLQQTWREPDTIGTPTFAQLAQQRLDIMKRGKASSRKSTRSRLNMYWMPAFGHVPIDQIRYADISAMLSPLYDSDLAPKTLREIISDGSGVFLLAVKSGHITSNPCTALRSEIKRTKRQVDPFTDDELEAILQALSPQHQLFYLLRWYCGLRPGEAIALQWRDIRGGKMHVHRNRVDGIDGTTKTDAEREVPIHPRIQAALNDQVRQLHVPEVIVTREGHAYRRVNAQAAAFNKARERLGIRYRDPYNVRHSCATRMLAAGMKPAYCAKVLGHSLEMFFRNYATWIDQDENARQEAIWFGL